MPFTPYPYQRWCASRIEQFAGRALVSMEQGTGKTATSLLWSYRNSHLRPIVVVCPAGLKRHWQREAKEFFGMESLVLETTKPLDYIPELPELLIVNYSIVHAWVDWLRELSPKIIIIDEAQALRDLRSRQCKATKRLCSGVPHVLVLSGTPIMNRPKELYPLLNIILPDRYPKAMTFYWRYCNPKQTPWGLKVDGAKNLDELHRNLVDQCLVRVRKEDVLRDLPPKRRIVVPVEIDDRREYDRANLDFLDWLGGFDREAAFRAASAQALTKIGYLRRLVGQLKLPAIYDWTDSYLENSDDKLVLFALHREVIDALSSRFGKLAVVIDGRTAPDSRLGIIDKFHNDNGVRILVGNIQAAGTGFSIRCSKMGFCELPWTPPELEQAIDRCHGLRRGIEGEITTAYLFVADRTIDKVLLKILDKKHGIAVDVLDGGRGEQLDLLGLFAEEMQQIKAGFGLV